MIAFIKRNISWILLGLLLGFGLMMLGLGLAKAPEFEFFNKNEIVCFKTNTPTCYKLITIK